MIYSDPAVLKKTVKNNLKYGQMIEAKKEEVQSFCQTFSDDPKRVSRWGHHYFCPKDGGLLIFDRKKPTEHTCKICGETYNNDLLNGVWVYMYRNEAIVTAWKSALLYKVTNDSMYLDHVRMIIGFYAEHYLSFELHNKEGNTYDSLEEMAWGCGRIMPQGLNESLLMIRMVNALELVKDDIGQALLSAVSSMFLEVYKLIKPQVTKIHNINCWYNSAIGTMGLFLKDEAMIQFAFEGEFNIRRQLLDGVTEDGFWYEGSIHYNFFTLEGITNLLLFSKLYEYDFGNTEQIVEKMFINAYDYAFDNHQFPNPNDGWPNINLKSYSYIYCVAAKVFGLSSPVGNLLKNILNKDVARGVFPLSKPYYYENDISLERLALIPEIDPRSAHDVKTESVVFSGSYNGLLKNDRINIFHKYGHNGPSHAHPDKMNVEVIMDGQCLSRDLSNSGYGNALCNEWHRMSVSHNTVVVGGKNHTSTGPGSCQVFTRDVFETLAKDVYEGIDYGRKIELLEDGFKDSFDVLSDSLNHYDYFFHVEGQLIDGPELKKASLAYEENGYQHIQNVHMVITQDDPVTLKWQLGTQMVMTTIDITGKTLYLADTPDNPVNKSRKTMILSTDGSHVNFSLKWQIVEA